MNAALHNTVHLKDINLNKRKTQNKTYRLLPSTQSSKYAKLKLLYVYLHRFN